jgi:hypothetical protein
LLGNGEVGAYEGGNCFFTGYRGSEDHLFGAALTDAALDGFGRVSERAHRRRIAGGTTTRTPAMVTGIAEYSRSRKQIAGLLD